MKKQNLYKTVQGAMIGALYVCLTLLSGALGLSSGSIQLRFSEALCVLPYFTPAAVPGLFVGCLLSNLILSSTPLDLIFGSLATLIGALGTYFLRKRSPFLAPIPPIFANTLILPAVIAAASGMPLTPPALLGISATVFLGEAISCGVLGIPLMRLLTRYAPVLFPDNNKNKN